MTLCNQIISKLESIGSARTLLSKTLDHELFQDLSKHNPYWDSEDAVAGEKLYDIRVSLGGLQDTLYDIWVLLRQSYNDLDDD